MTRPHELPQSRRLLQLVGIAVIGVALICNEWLIARLLSADAVLGSTSRWCLRLVQLVLIVSGYGLTQLADGRSVRAVLRRQRRLVALGVGVGFAGLLVIAAEWVAGVGLARRVGPATVGTGSYRHGFFVNDPLLGYRPRADTAATSVVKLADRTVYDVVYTIDQHGRRVTPGAATNVPNLLFFGCSFTFGEGLHDRETLPAHVAAQTERYRPVNYGFCGYGPQQMLAKLERGAIDRELSGPAAIAVYTIMDGHIERAVGAMREFLGWAARFPYYSLDDGRLVFHGDFLTGRPWTTRLYKVVGRSNVATLLNVQLPRIGVRHELVTAAIVVESAVRFRELFGSDRFYVVAYPGSRRLKSVLAMVAAAGVGTLDYSELFELSEAGMSIPDDGHPTSAANRRVAEALVRDLRLND